MTVSQMTATSTAESHQQRLHWLAEQVLDWSGLPVVHLPPTTFLDNPLFTALAAQSIRENGTIALPFGTGRTSPIAADDVARVAATILRDPGDHASKVYELTGPRTLDMTEAAKEFSRALGRTVTYHDVPLHQWRTEVLAKAGLPPHTEQHIATMAQLHHANRYDRATLDVERIREKAPDRRGVRHRPQGLLLRLTTANPRSRRHHRSRSQCHGEPRVMWISCWAGRVHEGLDFRQLRQIGPRLSH